MKRLYRVAIILGLILTPFAHELATKQRGYTAIGGEFFIIPLFMLIALLVDQMCEMAVAVKNMQEKEKSC